MTSTVTTATEIAALVDSIYKTDYYVDLLQRLCDPSTLHANPEAISILNRFWFSLPDDRSIRTPTFFRLCDVIENAAEPDDHDESDTSIPPF